MRNLAQAADANTDATRKHRAVASDERRQRAQALANYNGRLCRRSELARLCFHRCGTRRMQHAGVRAIEARGLLLLTFSDARVGGGLPAFRPLAEIAAIPNLLISRWGVYRYVTGRSWRQLVVARPLPSDSRCIRTTSSCQADDGCPPPARSLLRYCGTEVAVIGASAGDATILLKFERPD